MQWYYQDKTAGEIPFDENYIAALSSDNRIKSNTLVWNDSLAGWIPAAEAFPEAFPGAAISPSGVAASRPAPVAAAAKQNPLLGSGGKANLTRESVPIKNADFRELVKDLASYICANRFWMNFFGVLMIVIGILLGLTMVGLVIAWLPVWSGVILLKAGKSAYIAETAGTIEPLEDAISQLSLFFKIHGITAMVVIVLYLAAIVAFVMMGGLGMINELPLLPEGIQGAGETSPFGGNPAQ